MTDWFEPFTRLTPPSDDVMWSKCRVGHMAHDTITLHNRGPTWMLAKPIPVSHIYHPLTFEVYDWFNYGGDALDKWQDYCPGQDIISREISQTGGWERYESLLFCDILYDGEQPRSEQMVLDFGCHLGWYSTIAITFGYTVAAIDANRENCHLTITNTQMNGESGAKASVFCGAVDEHAPLLDADMPVRVAKIDIEGAEQWAIRMLSPTLEARNVDYLLMEVSPVFNDTYPDLVEQIAGYGYDVYVIPHSAPRVDNPLETLMRHLLVEQDRRSVVAAFHQEDLLFARRP